MRGWGVLYTFSSSCCCKLSRPGFVEGAVSEHREEYVGSASSEGDDGLIVALSFGPFLVVVGARCGVAFDRSESGQEQHTFKDFVAASGRTLTTD